CAGAGRSPDRLAAREDGPPRHDDRGGQWPPTAPPDPRRRARGGRGAGAPRPHPTVAITGPRQGRSMTIAFRGARAFRHRNYRLFFAGQAISLVGTWMQQVAQGWLVLQLTHDPLWLG